MARILVVEDNAENRQYMTYVLTNLGHVVEEACDGATGLAAGLGSDYDLILLDLQMPLLDGFEVLRQLREARADLKSPIVAVTAFAMTGDRERATAAGFDDYLTKPLRPTDLVSAVTRLVA